MATQLSTDQQKPVDEKGIRNYAFLILNDFQRLRKGAWDHMLASYFKDPGKPVHNSWHIKAMEHETTMLEIYQNSLEALRYRYIGQAQIYLPLLSRKADLKSPILYVLDEFMATLQKAITEGEFSFQDPTLLAGHVSHTSMTNGSMLPYAANFHVDVHSYDQKSYVHITGYQIKNTSLQTVCEGFHALLGQIKSLILPKPPKQTNAVRIHLIFLIDALLAQARSIRHALKQKMEIIKALTTPMPPPIVISRVPVASHPQRTATKQFSYAPVFSSGIRGGKRGYFNPCDSRNYDVTRNRSNSGLTFESYNAADQIFNDCPEAIHHNGNSSAKRRRTCQSGNTM